MRTLKFPDAHYDSYSSPDEEEPQQATGPCWSASCVSWAWQGPPPSSSHHKCKPLLGPSLLLQKTSFKALLKIAHMHTVSEDRLHRVDAQLFLFLDPAHSGSDPLPAALTHALLHPFIRYRLCGLHPQGTLSLLGDSKETHTYRERERITTQRALRDMKGKRMAGGGHPEPSS